MSRWIAKAVVQGVIARLPRPHRWNEVLQRHVSGSLDLSVDRFISKWARVPRHLQNWGPTPPSVVLELGTGWYPVVPIGLALCGVQTVVSCDIRSHLRAEAVLATLRRYQECLAREEFSAAQPDAAARVERALQGSSRSAAKILAPLGIELRTGDVARAGLDPGSVDLFVSNNTLEHVPGPGLLDLFRAFARYAHSSSKMSHYIDLADHYASADASISEFNYLQYSERTWRLFNNALHYQNRLQISEYLRLHQEGGWRVVDHTSERGSLDELRSISVHPEFSRFSEAELTVLGAWVVSEIAAIGPDGGPDGGVAG